MLKLSPRAELAELADDPFSPLEIVTTNLDLALVELEAGRSGEKVRAAIATDKAAWLIEAADGAADGRRKLVSLAERRPNPPRVLAAFTSGELGLALGGENVIHLAFLAGRGAERWTVDVERFSGFRPLLPQSWREEP